MERLPGFRDFYPEPLPQPDMWSADARQYIFAQWRGTARRYGFREYDGPPLEPLELFTLKSGQEIVGQLYNFKDKGDREIALLTEADIVIRLSSRNAWHDFFVRNQGDPAREYDFYQIIDKLERETPEQSTEKLAAIGFSLADVSA